MNEMEQSMEDWANETDAAMGETAEPTVIKPEAAAAVIAVAAPLGMRAQDAVLPDRTPSHENLGASEVMQLRSGLMGAEAQAASAAAIDSLVQAVASERAAQIHRGGPTIEDIVNEAVRPLLKSWLDQHMPPLVEGLVRAEINRIATREPGA